MAAIAQAPCGDKVKDKSGHVTGTTQMKIAAGESGKARALYKGSGASVAMPVLPPTLPVTVQLIVNEQDRQDCWTATYSSFGKSDGEQFKATSD